MAGVVIPFPRLKDCSKCVYAVGHATGRPWCTQYMEDIGGEEGPWAGPSLEAEACEFYEPSGEAGRAGGSSTPARLHDLQRHVRRRVRAPG